MYIPLRPGSMREYLPSQEALNDDNSKQRIRKHPKARKSSIEEIVGEPKSAFSEGFLPFRTTVSLR